MTDLTTIRISSLPRGVACPGSLRPSPDGSPPVSPSNDVSALGSAVHEVLATIINMDLDHIPPIISKVAQRHGVDPGDLECLSNIGLNRWRSLRARGMFPDPEAEWSGSMEVAGVKITGHIDVMSRLVHADMVRIPIVDFKSGRRDNDHYHQIVGYGMLALDEYPDAAAVDGMVAWLLDDEIESISMTRVDVERWRDEVLIGRVINWDGVYHPGPQCEHCPRFAGCPARAAMVRSAVSELAISEEQVRSILTDLITGARGGDLKCREAIVRAYEKVQIVTTTADYFRKAIKQEIEANGPITAGMHELSVSDQTVQTIKPAPAMAVLEQLLSGDEILSACKISKTTIMDLIGDKAAKGRKGKDQKAMLEQLAAAGAIEESERKVLKLKRV